MIFVSPLAGRRMEPFSCLLDPVIMDFNYEKDGRGLKKAGISFHDEPSRQRRACAPRHNVSPLSTKQRESGKDWNVREARNTGGFGLFTQVKCREGAPPRASRRGEDVKCTYN